VGRLLTRCPHVKQSQFVSYVTSMVEVLVDQVQHLVHILLLLISLFLSAPFIMLLMFSFVRCIVQHVTGFLKFMILYTGLLHLLEAYIVLQQ
jgi:flagellar biosynthesis protein FliP